jgi:peptidyl-prolyl cis-trans isomerase B (cyclophilin B)
VASIYNKKMSYRKQIISLFVLFHGGLFHCFSQTAAHTLLIETSMGNMKCILYGETPMHTDNFVELVNNGYYNGLLFHRVINNFMIQTGDSNSRNARKGSVLGYGGVNYTVPAEFHPDLYHKKGVLAAARQGDKVNPDRRSSGAQFYIVQGKKISDAEMDAMEAGGSHIPFTQDQRKTYRNIGGTPHLDYGYTVFGEVIEGVGIIDKIASVPVDGRNRPVEDVRITRITLLK